MFLFHVVISENGFYTIFGKFNRSFTKLEDADKIRSLDGNKDLNGTKVIFYKMKVNGYQKKRSKWNKSNCL